MKKIIIVCVLCFGFVAATDAALTINLGGGILYGANTSSPLPAGTLVQLVVDRNNDGFATPAVGSFTGNSSDDLVLASFAVGGTGLNAGEFGSAVVFSLGNNVDVGDHLILRWFPGLTTSSSAPTSGQTFGQFRTDIVQVVDGSDINWNVPADGLSYFLTFYTASDGGSNPDSAGLANMTVVLIPEPTTYAFLMVGLAGAAFLHRRKRMA